MLIECVLGNDLCVFIVLVEGFWGFGMIDFDFVDVLVVLLLFVMGLKDVIIEGFWVLVVVVFDVCFVEFLNCYYFNVFGFCDFKEVVFGFFVEF